MCAAFAAEPIALLELYTSQGCSSCPPADVLLSDIATEARESDRPIYVLSFHVDYWDRLGWKDPFSDARWTARQRKYSMQFGNSGRVYTPQLVVNGAHEGVGSNEPLVKAMVARAMTTQAEGEITGEATAGESKVKVGLQTTVDHGQMYVAVVEKKRTVEIEAGENKGKTLSHVNIVRGLVVAEPGKVEGMVEVPEGVDLAHAEVVVWVEHETSGAVIAAARLPISGG